MRRDESATPRRPDDRGIFSTLAGDGQPLLLITAFSLMFSGGFAMFLAVTGDFLPHDLRYLGMGPDELCAAGACEVVHFMIHDRAAFGGALFAIGALCAWLTAYPLSAGERWAWWTLVVTAGMGFGSFLSYLGYGYLDAWHAIGTLILVPLFAAGLLRSRRLLDGRIALQRPARWGPWRSGVALGRMILLATAAGMIIGGLAILVVGVTTIFVPSDLVFIGMTAAELSAVSERLVPLIAHDRAGFGGAVATTGVALFSALWFSPPSRSLWQVIAVAAGVAAGAAIGTHYHVGYTDLLHVAPAWLGAVAAAAGLMLTAPSTVLRDRPG